MASKSRYLSRSILKQGNGNSICQGEEGDENTTGNLTATVTYASSRRSKRVSFSSQPEIREIPKREKCDRTNSKDGEDGNKTICQNGDCDMEMTVCNQNVFHDDQLVERGASTAMELTNVGLESLLEETSNEYKIMEMPQCRPETSVGNENMEMTQCRPETSVGNENMEITQCQPETLVENENMEMTHCQTESPEENSENMEMTQCRPETPNENENIEITRFKSENSNSEVLIRRTYQLRPRPNANPPTILKMPETNFLKNTTSVIRNQKQRRSYGKFGWAKTPKRKNLFVTSPQKDSEIRVSKQDKCTSTNFTDNEDENNACQCGKCDVEVTLCNENDETGFQDDEFVGVVIPSDMELTNVQLNSLLETASTGNQIMEMTQCQPETPTGNETVEMTQCQQEPSVGNENMEMTQCQTEIPVGNETGEMTQCQQEPSVGNENMEMTQCQTEIPVGNETGEMTQCQQEPSVENENMEMTQCQPEILVINEKRQLAQCQPETLDGNENMEMTMCQSEIPVGNENKQLALFQPEPLAGNENIQLALCQPENPVVNENIEITKCLPENSLGNENKMTQCQPELSVVNDNMEMTQFDNENFNSNSETELPQTQKNTYQFPPQPIASGSNPPRLLTLKTPEINFPKNDTNIIRNQNQPPLLMENWNEHPVLSLIKDYNIIRSVKRYALVFKIHDALCEMEDKEFTEFESFHSQTTAEYKLPEKMMGIVKSKRSRPKISLPEESQFHIGGRLLGKWMDETFGDGSTFSM